MRSASSILAASLASLVVCGAHAEPLPGRIRLVVQSAPLAGSRYYAVKEVAADLRVGDPLELAREADNPHDANAVSVSWGGRKLGYVPRRDNAAIAWALDRGDRLHARISRLTARRLELEIYMQ